MYGITSVWYDAAAPSGDGSKSGVLSWFGLISMISFSSSTWRPFGGRWWVWSDVGGISMAFVEMSSDDSWSPPPPLSIDVCCCGGCRQSVSKSDRDTPAIALNASKSTTPCICVMGDNKCDDGGGCCGCCKVVQWIWYGDCTTEESTIGRSGEAQ